MRTRTVTTVVVVAALLGASLAACHEAATEQAGQEGFLLNVQFDGGYLYRLKLTDAIDVVSLAESKFKPHPMFVEVTEATIENAKRGWFEDGKRWFEVKDGRRLELWPDGNPPGKSKPATPKPSDLTGCDPKHRNMDSLSFLPSLNEVAKEMGTDLRPSPAQSAAVRLTGGGRLRIAKVGGCVEYRYPDGRKHGPPRWMASGERGIHYDWYLSHASKLTLMLVSPEAKPEPIADLVPAVEGNQRVVRLEVGGDGMPVYDQTEHRIDHFDSFDPVFNEIDSNRKLSLWWLPRPGILGSPGIDCPSGSGG